MPDKREQLIDIMQDAAKGETKEMLRRQIAALKAENEEQRERLVQFANAFDAGYAAAERTRPSEQAVTEAMVERIVQATRRYTRETFFIEEHRELVRAVLALKEEGL